MLSLLTPASILAPGPGLSSIAPHAGRAIAIALPVGRAFRPARPVGIRFVRAPEWTGSCDLNSFIKATCVSGLGWLRSSGNLRLPSRRLRSRPADPCCKGTEIWVCSRAFFQRDSAHAWSPRPPGTGFAQEDPPRELSKNWRLRPVPNLRRHRAIQKTWGCLQPTF